jgi:hypothetical protein
MNNAPIGSSGAGMKYGSGNGISGGYSMASVPKYGGSGISGGIG